jgi:alkylhydroperoxidase family enzyme
MTDLPLPPLDPDDWPGEIADLAAGFAGALNVYRTMAHHPALLRAWGALRAHVVRDSALSPRQREAVTLRAAHRLAASYEWDHHVSRGRAAGMADRDIAALAGPVEAVAEQDRPFARAVDELAAGARLRPATAADLAARVGKKGMLDVMATVGFYTTLAYVVNSCDTPLDPAIAAELADRPLGAG